MRRFRVLFLVCALLVVAIAPMAIGAEDDAVLELIPSSGFAGTTVTTEGSEFSNPGLTVEIRWDDWDGPLLDTVETEDMQGVIGFTTTITIPPGATPGTYDVVACVVGFGVECDDITNEFHEGASTTFTVTPPPTTTTAATTTSTTSTSTTSTTSTTTTTTTTIPDDGELLLPQNLDDFPRIIPDGPEGLFGEYLSPVDGVSLELFIPRCVAPEGSTVLDFDTDRIGGFPRTYDIPALGRINQGVAVAPAGSISPRQAIHLSRNIGAHRVVEFSTPQRYVGLHVGDFAETGLPITLVAYDGGFNVVAADRISSAHAPADVCMVAGADEASIAMVSIHVDSSADLYVDRLFFGTEGFPYEPLGERGSVEFLRPRDFDEVSARVGQVVLGIIRVPEAFEIDEAVLSVPWWDRSRVIHRHVDFHELWVEDGDQLYLFVTNRVYVPEGSSWLTLTATGPGVIATGGVEVVGVGMPPLHDEDVTGRVDIEPITIEVTQAIRGEVDLIDPGAVITERGDAVLVQNKKTVVRGFARLRFPDGFTYSGDLAVNAELVGTRNGEALPGSPLTPVRPTVDLRVWTDRAGAYHAQKQETHLSWNFVLPDSWTDPGSIDLRLEVNSPALAGHIDEHPDFDGELNVIGVDDVIFRSKNAPEVNIWLVDYWFKCDAADIDGNNSTFRDGFTGATPTGSDSFCAGLPVGKTTHAQPTGWQAAEVIVESWNMAPFPGPAPAVFDIWEYTFATDGVSDDEIDPGPQVTPGSPQEGFWLGVAFRMDLIVGVDGYNALNALMSSFVRGKAWGSPSFFRVTPNPTTFIHEAGHTMGLRHTGNQHGESGWIARWDGDHGEIDRSREVVSAFDTYRMEALRYSGVGGTDGFRHDYMSYGNPRWTSLALWHHVEDAVGSGVARVDNRVDDDAWRLFWEIWPFDGPPSEDAPADDEIVVVSGTLTGGDVELTPGFNRRTGAILNAEGEILLRVLAADGTTLSESPTLLLESNDDPDGAPAFIAPLFMPEGAAEVVVFVRGDEMGRFEVMPPPSGVTNPRPSSGGAEPEELEVGRDPLDLSWEPGSGADRYLVEITRDGREWYSIGITDEPRFTLDPSILPFQGPGWRMRVQASTGLTVAISPEIAVEFTAPREAPPMILLPVDGSVVSANTLIDLRAAVSSFSTGEEDRYVWRVDGTQVAEGPTGTTFAGEPGDHVVTLTSPETGLEATATITVVADSDLDGMSDEWEREWGFDPEDPSDAGSDGDDDGVSAASEFRHGSSPESIDTDGDDYSDSLEIAIGTDPNDPDSYPGSGFDGEPAPTISGGEAAAPKEDDTGSGGGPNLILIVLAAGLVGAAIAGGFFWRRGRGAGGV